MTKASRSLELSASADLVWDIWSKPNSWPRWNPEVLSVSLDGELAPGTTGEMVTKQHTHRITFVWVQPGRSFAYETAPMPLIRLLFTCEVIPREAGCTAVQSVEVSGPLSTLLAGPLSKQVADGFPATLEALKHAAEGARVS